MNVAKLITDIDNTIADTTRRMRRSLREIGREEVFEKTSDQFGGFSEYLSSSELDQLWEVFLSGRFIHLDEPAPGAADLLTEFVHEGLELTYLTGRHDQQGDTMRPATEEWLAEHGFPLPGKNGVELFMKPGRGIEDREFKLDLLKQEFSLGSTGMIAGIGDHPDDGLVYSEAGIKPIMLNWQGFFSERELEAPAEGAKVVESWSEIGKEVEVLDSG